MVFIMRAASVTNILDAWRRVGASILALGLVSFALASCGNDVSDPPQTTGVPRTTASSASSTSTTETSEPDTSTTERSGSETSSTDNLTTTTKAGASSTTTPAVDTPAGWLANAGEHRGKVGERVTYECEPAGVVGSVWGSNPYTDDSSVCTAAVHAGLIQIGAGGRVEIEIAAGSAQYLGTEANGVKSASYGAFEGSFVFPGLPTTGDSNDIAWSQTPAALGLKVGDEGIFACEAGGTPGSVWGTGSYTADSSLCTAAVHAGLFSVEDGGQVAVRVEVGLTSYEGSTQNGVTSSDYGEWDPSFTVSAVG